MGQEQRKKQIHWLAWRKYCRSKGEVDWLQRSHSSSLGIGGKTCRKGFVATERTVGAGLQSKVRGGRVLDLYDSMPERGFSHVQIHVGTCRFSQRSCQMDYWRWEVSAGVGWRVGQRASIKFVASYD